MVPLRLEGVFIAQEEMEISNLPKRKVGGNDPTGLGLSHVLNPASIGKIVWFIAILVCDRAKKKKLYKAARSKQEAHQEISKADFGFVSDCRRRGSSGGGELGEYLNDFSWVDLIDLR